MRRLETYLASSFGALTLNTLFKVCVRDFTLEFSLVLPINFDRVLRLPQTHFQALDVKIYKYIKQ